MAIKVKAIRPGYFNHRRIKEGDVFVLKTRKGKKQDSVGKLEDIIITPEQQFSALWMEKLGDVSEQPLGEEEDEELPKPRGRRKQAAFVDDSVI